MWDIFRSNLEAHDLLAELCRDRGCRIRRQPHGLPEAERRQPPDLIAERGAEQHRLPLLRGHADDLSYLLLEPHLEESVRLVEYEHGKVLQAHALLIMGRGWI